MVELLVVNSSQPSVAFHILIRPNQVTGFFDMKHWVDKGLKDSSPFAFNLKEVKGRL